MNFSDADLREVDFSETKLDECIFKGANVEGTKFPEGFKIKQ